METLCYIYRLQNLLVNACVLNHVGFELQSAEIIGLIGPSGAGKSTMIKTMLGMERQMAVHRFSLRHTMPNRHILGDIQLYGPDLVLYEALSGQENLEFSVS